MDMQMMIQRSLLQHAVGRAITCPRCQQVLDMRTAVTATLTVPHTDGTNTSRDFTTCTKCWDTVRLELHDLAMSVKGSLEVIDARMLWPITQAQVKAACKAAGCAVKIVDGEYQIKLKGAPEVTTYYTEDALDAIYTAQAMAAHRAKLEASICKWFLRCTNPATGTLAHPTLGGVPICDRCRAIATQEAK